MLRRHLLRSVAFLALIAGGAAMLAFVVPRAYDKVLDLRYGATLRPTAGPPPRTAAEARLQDLDYLAGLPTGDRSVSAEAAGEFGRRIGELRANAATIDAGQLFMGVARAVASSGNAHTAVDDASWQSRLARAPVRFAWFPEGLFVVRAAGEAIPLLGMRVLSIDGFEPEMIAAQAADYIPGTAQRVRAVSPWLLESPEALHALHSEASAERLDLRVADAKGMAHSASLAALRAVDAPSPVKPGRELSPEPIPGEHSLAWRALLAQSPIPESLRGPTRSVHAARLSDEALYVHLWKVRDDPGDPVDAQIERALGAGGWKRIVLDLRFDAGGDYPRVYHALRRMGRALAPDGRLAILVDDTTFSAAMICAVLARHFVGERAVVLGSVPGDRLAFWAEGTPLTLPNSGIVVGVGTGFHDWAHGCRVLACWWPNFYYDVAGGDLAPDIPVRWSFADYERGRDSVLIRALE
jgi:hypothetical protein